MVDINYFPGYEKVPGYADLAVKFLMSVVYGESEETQMKQQDSQDFTLEGLETTMEEA